MPDVMSRPPSPPEGWTFDPEELYYEHEWAADDSAGQALTAAYGLGKGYPVMACPERMKIMFKAGGKFYVWNQEGDYVQEIVSSTDLGEIISIMKEGERALRCKKLK
ncbi:hypothetical protein V8E54_008985 [Elaphomyces granulatus]